MHTLSMLVGSNELAGESRAAHDRDVSTITDALVELYGVPTSFRQASLLGLSAVYAVLDGTIVVLGQSSRLGL